MKVTICDVCYYERKTPPMPIGGVRLRESTWVISRKNNYHPGRHQRRGRTSNRGRTEEEECRNQRLPIRKRRGITQAPQARRGRDGKERTQTKGKSR
jgi:hypothetical protein